MSEMLVLVPQHLFGVGWCAQVPQGGGKASQEATTLKGAVNF